MRLTFTMLFEEFYTKKLFEQPISEFTLPILRECYNLAWIDGIKKNEMK